MQPALFDSSVYISALRQDKNAVLAVRRLSADTPLWLSSVVLEEIYAGTGEHEGRAVERLERDFERARRILVPNLTDWTRAGKVLAHLAEKYDYEQIGRGRLTNDALIAMSAGRVGITVWTMNERDFSKLAEFSPFRWQLTSF